MSNIRRSSEFQGAICADQIVTILDGQTESTSAQLSGTSVVAIDFPVGFSGTSLTFLVSSDSINYKEYRRMIDGELVTAVVGANGSYASGFFDFGGYEWIKLVSNVAQTGDVEITLKTRPI